jgi:hypothetical protein
MTLQTTHKLNPNLPTTFFAPGAPAPRSGHAAAVAARAGGQLWMYGGEVANPNGTRFRHYTELWCLHLAEKRWEEVKAPNPPQGRSGTDSAARGRPCPRI